MGIQSDDNALAKTAASGDRDAFEKLISQHYQTNYNIAYQWCGQQTDAEDITQNVCIKLAHTIGSFRGKSEFSTWLYTLVINSTKDWQRHKSAVSHKHRYDNDADVAINTSIDKTVYIHQVMQQVFQLPDTEKEAVLLVLSAGLSHLEAATVMGCKENTISWRIYEARK